MTLEWISSSCVLILVILLLRAALGNKISTGLRYAVWGIVLARLLLPVPLFTSPLAGMSVSLSPVVSEKLQEQSIYVLPVQSIPAESQTVKVQEDGTVLDPYPFGYPRLENNGETIVRYAQKVSPLEVLQLLWMSGCIVIMLVFLCSNLHFAVKLRRVRRPLEGVDCKIPVYIADGLPSPCLFGVIRPAVYMTTAAAGDPTILRHVLAHEMTHYKHFDHIWSILRSIALAVHWWNPLVWLAAVSSRRDGELACDAGALKRLGKEERLAYGETLLSLVTAKPSPKDLLNCATTMSGEKRSLRERIRRISCEQKPIVSAVMILAVLVSATAVCTFGQIEASDRSDGWGTAQTTAAGGPCIGFTTDIIEGMEVFTMLTPAGRSKDDSYNGPILSGNRKEGLYTFLLFGNDRSAVVNTDTIMVASYDTVNQNVSILSIPRNMMGKDDLLISRVYHSGGIDALKESVEGLIGFTPDFYMKIDPSMLEQLVDMLGGVEFDVPQDMNYDDPYQDLHIHLNKGVQTLSGEDAVKVLRYRLDNEFGEGYADSERMNTQCAFLKAFLGECLKWKNLGQVKSYIHFLAENIETDLDVNSMLWFAANMLGMLELNSSSALCVDEIHTYTLPYKEDSWDIVKGQSVVILDLEEAEKMVNERFNPYT